MRRRAGILLSVTWLLGCQGELPPYSVHVRALSDMRYELDIIRSSDHVVLQTIAIRHGLDPSAPAHLELLDLNRDGHPDLRVLGGRTAQGSWYKVWHFDPATATFIWSHATEPARSR